MPAPKDAPKIKWDNHPKMRLALLVIRENLEMSSRDCVKIMNVAFLNEMVASGYPQGLPEDKSDTLQSQYREQFKKGNEGKWRFEAEEREEMIETLKEIASDLGLEVLGEGGAAKDPEDGDEDEAQDAPGGEDEEEESEPDDGEREEAGSDEDFTEARASARPQRASSASNIKDTHKTRGRSNTRESGQQVTTGGSKAAKPRKKTTAAGKTEKTPSRRQPKREPKLRQSAMPKHEKFKETVFNPIGVPGFSPMQSTTEFFGQGPIPSPFVVGDPEDARPRYETGDKLSETDLEDDQDEEEDAPHIILGEAPPSDPIPVDSDFESSGLHGEEDEVEDNFNYNGDEGPDVGDREPQEDSDSDFIEPGKKQPVRSARIPIKRNANANDIEKGRNDKGKQKQKQRPLPEDIDGEDEDEDNIVIASRRAIARPWKGKEKAIDLEEPGQESGNSQKPTSQNVIEVSDDDSDLSSVPDDEGTPPPPRKKAVGVRRGTWAAMGKKRPSNFRED